MEPMNVFYRIFHEDLHPLTNQKTKLEYLDYVKNKSSNGGYINDDLKSLKTQECNKQKLKYSYYEYILIDVLKQIKRDLHQKMFLYIDSNNSIEGVIQNYQIFLLNYMKIIEENYLPKKYSSPIFQISKEKSDTDIFKIIYKTLDAILIYLEQTFMKYMDRSIEIPYQQHLWFISQHKDTVIKLQQKINTLDLSDIVKKAICKPLVQIEQNEFTRLTYQTREYYQIFIKVLSHLLKNEQLPSKEKVYSVLISLNYNTFEIFFFLTAIIKDKVKSASGSQEKVQIFQKYLKEVKTTTVTAIYSHKPELPALKEQLILWLEEELLFYNHKLEFEEVHSYATSQTGKASIKKMLKISVPEVSLFTKLLYDSQLVDGSKKELFSFLSATFRTQKTTLISPESLSNNYYSVSEGSKRSVKKMLTKMLLQLDQMIGETFHL